MSRRMIAALSAGMLLTACQAGSGDGGASQRAEEAAGPARPAEQAPSGDGSTSGAPAQSTPAQPR